MASKKNVIKATGKAALGTVLTPTVVKNETQAMDIATTSGRKRPFVAINDEGKMVVCSRRTAAKYGWEAQGALYARTSDKPIPVKEPAAPAKKSSKAVWEEAVKPKKEEATLPQASSITRAVRRVVRSEFAKLTGRK